MEHNYDEKTVKAAISLILDVVAEDKHKIKTLEKENEQMKTENHNLLQIANEYINKSDELSAENVRLMAQCENRRANDGT